MSNFRKYIMCLCVLTGLNLQVCGECKSLSHKVFENGKIHVDKTKKQSGILTLDGTKNTRYLGIYKDVNGNPLNKKAFLRSDNTNNLSEDDIKKLKDLDVKTVIDLRYPNELQKAPDKFMNMDGVKYHNITLAVNRKYSLYDGYVKALENKKLIKSIFETIANAEEGAILFHCTYGKDRTGILSMLLLGVANVKDECIIKNYLDGYLFDCPKKSYNEKYKKYRANMKKTIKYINDQYESFDNYILSTGLSEEDLYKVKKRINPSLIK